MQPQKYIYQITISSQNKTATNLSKSSVTQDLSARQSSTEAKTYRATLPDKHIHGHTGNLGVWETVKTL